MNIEDLYRLMRTSHVQAQGIVDTAPDSMLVLDESLRVQAANRAFCQTFKVDRDETLGRYIYDLGNGQWDIPDLRLLLGQVIPRAGAIIDYEVTHDFPAIGWRTMLLTARTLHHPDSGSHSMLLSIVDATERFKRDAAKDMLFGELRHRMKNMLAMAQSIARNTTTEGRSAEEFRDAFMGRFSALIDAQDLAFSEQDDMALESLIQRILAPYASNGGSVVVEPGEAIDLPPKTIMSLALVLHELATNAVKYGGLSAPGGGVRVGWQTDATGPELRIFWKEHGGPHVTPPSKTGYGTQLIQSATTYSLGGRVEQNYVPHGLEVTIIIPPASARLPS